ncbi:MAG TPA: M3 family metallopeptidase, partial [Myxococcota bacterium]|nr:M3 family metallopeptidase [Myxococcota bacterium]
AMADLTRGGEAPSAEHGPWRLTLDAPCVIPFLEYAEKRELREVLYRAYIGRAGPEGDAQHDNTQRVLEILRLRREQAQLLGFADYAAYSLDAKMAPDVDTVNKLLLSLHGKSRVAAVRELAELTAFAVDSGNNEALQLWDVAFWARRLREARFSYSDEDLKPYFPLPAVLKGAFSLVERLFGVRIQRRDGVTGWHPDVSYYEVEDGGRVVASFFLDPYSRPADKRSGAWMNELRGRSARLAALGEAYRTPIAYLVCNQAPPVGSAPSLMTWSEVTTLFHELGHGLQHMLTAVDHLAVSGINGVEWDAVELPSQFMENFLRHKAFLRSFARHHETGEPIPDALVDKVLAAATFRAGSAFLRQLYFGRLDLALHTGEPPADSEALWALMHRVAAENTVIAPLPEDRFLCSFGHLFAGGYAAGYYSYKWAEVLSADAFSAFEEAGLDDDKAMAEVGRRFRETVLGLGGSVPPMEVFVRFRGREPDAEALLRHNGLAA